MTRQPNHSEGGGGGRGREIDVKVAASSEIPQDLDLVTDLLLIAVEEVPAAAPGTIETTETTMTTYTLAAVGNSRSSPESESSSVKGGPSSCSYPRLALLQVFLRSPPLIATNDTSLTIELRVGGGEGGGVPVNIQGAVTSASPLPPPFENAGGLALGTSEGKVHSVTVTMKMKDNNNKVVNTTGAKLESSVTEFEVCEILPAVEVFPHTETAAADTNARCPVVAMSFDPGSGTGAAVAGGQLVIWKHQPLTIATGYDTPDRCQSENGDTAGQIPDAVSSCGVDVSRIVLTKGDERSAVVRALAWVPGMVVPCLVVGSANGGFDVYAQTRASAGGWDRIAALPEISGTEGGVSSLVCAAARGGRILGASGPSVFEVSDKVFLAAHAEERTLSR